MSLARLDLQSNRNEYKHFKCVNMFCVSCLFISALQMLILDAVGLQIRRSGFLLFLFVTKTGAPNDPCSVGFPLLGWICNPTVMNISILNA